MSKNVFQSNNKTANLSTNMHQQATSTLFYFSTQFRGLENLRNFEFVTTPSPYNVLQTGKHTHTHTNTEREREGAQRETAGWRRTLHLQLERFTRQDFLQILQFNFSLPRGEDAALSPASYPRALASAICVCQSITTMNILEGTWSRGFLVRLFTLSWSSE